MATETRGTSADFSVHAAQTVDDFLEYLLPNQPHWAGARRGELAYRGQASSAWRLIPKAFRDGEVMGYEGGGLVPKHDRVAPQAQAEFEALRQFVRAADRAGLEVGEAGGRLLLPEDPQHVFGEPDWEYRWPQDDMLPVLALAQHHGVPTRLLDFTDDPSIASYFATDSAWDEKEGRPVIAPGNTRLAVWVIDLRFIRGISHVRHRYPERVAEVRLPRAHNSFLHAQAGFFLIDRGANDVMHQGQPLSIEHAAAERARFWHSGDLLSRSKVEAVWFNERPIRKVELDSALTGELLIELDRRGTNMGTIMPSFDRVVAGLQLMRSVEQGR